MNNNPLVSIVVPNYNGKKYLKQCIDSVINQSYNNWELIICDDNSTDDSKEIIHSYQDKRIVPPIMLKQNQGAAVTRNMAIERAKGSFIAFLDNDDYWSPTKLEEQLKFMIENKYLFTYTNYIQFSEHKKRYVKCVNRVTKSKLLKNNYILTSTVMYNAQKLGKIYMANIRKRQDWSLFINIIEKSKYAYNLNKDLTYYRKHKDSISAKKLGLIKYNFNFYHNVLGYNKIISYLLMLRYITYYLLKKSKEKFF
ncbi:glycosyltransferase family 2 protein [Galbibacter sp. EGI 63066]|uniref:glycosyltransferase family 2 protein n=1 Tax=Galbibacter sp. EGI 63066 TaxID=2993559 RepID=UPI0022489733|nr:glycosyltransferase family 2 protein [Galbibacter sp. EGI 63066]MCX2680677.1 glycosyltransferase family 2 protein [Galbibacter sp. EGI 63066]